jgi:hypothetical protein
VPKLVIILFLALVLSGCLSPSSCPVTEPVWVLPLNDPAVQGEPAYGYYYVNADRSMWASAWWFDREEDYLISGEGVKVGWFRPEGVDLEIAAERLDGVTSGFEASTPCCYPTRFQATGLTFPAAGCWQVDASAGESQLSFVVQVKP